MPFVSDEVAERLRSDSLGLALLARLEFEDGERRLWTGFGSVELFGEAWEGVGPVEIDGISGGSAGSAAPVTLTVSGVDADLQRRAAGEGADLRGRPMTLYVCVFSQNGPPLALLPVWIGTMDRLVFSSSAGSRSIVLHGEQWFIGRAMAPHGLLSDRDQQARYPGDRGCEFVGTYAFRQVKWPSAG